MLSYINLATTALHSESATSKRIVQRATGLEGGGSPRQVLRPRPDAHGSIDTTKYTDGQLVVIEGECSGDTEEDAFAEWDTVKATLLATLPDGLDLKWQRGAGTELQRSVKLNSLTDPTVESVGTQLFYQAQLHSPDPRAYSQTEQSVSGDPLSSGGGGLVFDAAFNWQFSGSAGGQAEVVVGGSRATPPVLRAHGHVTSPQIVLEGTTDRIVLSGEIAQGDYIEIDCAESTVKLNGVTNRSKLLDDDESTFFTLPADTTSTLRLIGTNFSADAFLEVFWRDAH